MPPPHLLISWLFRLSFILVSGFLGASCSLHQCAPLVEPRPTVGQFSALSFAGAPHFSPKASFLTKSCPLTQVHVYPVMATKSRGTPLLLMHELGGAHDLLLQFALELEAMGWKVYVPLLDSDFGLRDPAEHARRIKAGSIWQVDQKEHSGQVLEDMKLLADWISSRHGGRTVTVMGNCLTGAFPLAMLGRRSVRTAVLCQPATPLKSAAQALLRLPEANDHRLALGIPAEDLRAAVDALRNDPSKRLFGFHYFADPYASFDKFRVIHDALSRAGVPDSRFRPVVLRDEARQADESWWEGCDQHLRPTLKKPAHSTVTGSPDEEDRLFLRRRFHQLVKP